MLPGYVPQPSLVHVRFQRAQLRCGHGLFRQPVRPVSSITRHPKRTVRGGSGGRRQPVAQAHQLVAVPQVEHAVVERNVQSLRCVRYVFLFIFSSSLAAFGFICINICYFFHCLLKKIAK